MHKRKQSKSSKFRSIRIDRLLQQENEHRKREIQVLLIGPPQSGKNTVCKQLRIHFGDGYPTATRVKLIPIILANLADAVSLVLENMNNLGIEFADESARKLSIGLLDSRPKSGYLAEVMRKNDQINGFHTESNFDVTSQSSSGTEDEMFSPIVHSRRDTKLAISTLTTSGQPTIENHGNQENMLLNNTVNPHDEYNYDGVNLPEAILRALNDHDSIPPSLMKRLELVADIQMMEQLQNARTNPVKFRSLLFEYVGSNVDQTCNKLKDNFRPPSPTSSPPKTFEEELLDCLLDENGQGSDDSITTSSSTKTDSQPEVQPNLTTLNQMTLPSNGLELKQEALSISVDADKTKSKQKSQEMEQALTDRKSKQFRENKNQFLVSSMPTGISYFNQTKSFAHCASSIQTLKVILKLLTEQTEFQDTIATRILMTPSIAYADSYFISHVDRIIQEDYLPTLQDILVMRQPSKAIRETLTSIGITSVRTIDLAEQGRYPNRHLHYFESVNIVLFLVSLEECIDAKNNIIKTHKLDEYISLFQSLITSPHMARKDFDVFLNKLDLVQCVNNQKNTTDPNGSDQAGKIDILIENIKQAFYAVHQQDNTKIGRLNFRVTCALDVDQMKNTMNDCLRGIFEMSRKRHAFL